jgi:gliding motility-associated lipoprotein GldD
MRALIKIVSCLVVLFTLACNSTYVQKPMGYPQITLPIKSYTRFNESGYPYSFDYPTYGVIEKKVSYLGVDKQKEAWLNIRFPEFGATLYMSYNHIAIGQPHMLDTLVRDAYTFANNHNSKASFIEDSAFNNGKDNKGVFFHIGGNVATAYQFFVTDSTTHFLRAALYFDTTPNEDSLAPINQFLFKDMQQMVRSFRWK